MPRQQPDKLHNTPDKATFRRKLRKSLTPAEATLWKLLKGSKIDGRKFRRQHSVGPYVLDFYCPQQRLAVELDGEGHFGDMGKLHDRERNKYLDAQGIKVLRFENEVVFDCPEVLPLEVREAFGWKTRDKS